MQITSIKKIGLLLALTATGLWMTGCIVVAKRRPGSRASVNGRVVVQTNGGEEVEPGETTVTTNPGAVSVGTSVNVGGGVSVVTVQCSPSATEACNGLDDNCNGVIDEGCGYQSGPVQITLAWATGADLDLFLVEPGGAEIYYKNPSSTSGGVLDHDGRGDCDGRNRPNQTVENIYFPTAPKGKFEVRVRYYGGGRCSSRAGQTTATVSLSVNGQVLSYNISLQPNDKLNVLNFEL